ncbi:MAG TPA: NAD(P)H-dependent oxidoreductase subunit E [Spirochaetota bacterium]|nr:NAD(P)H-dependent oxidoreductase subunit E [Spirochaetota bacterium]
MDAVTEIIKKAVSRYNGEQSKLLDIVRDVQGEIGLIDDETINKISVEMDVSAAIVTRVVEFYNFFYRRLCIAFV